MARFRNLLCVSAIAVALAMVATIASPVFYPEFANAVERKQVKKKKCGASKYWSMSRKKCIRKGKHFRCGPNCQLDEDDNCYCK